MGGTATLPSKSLLPLASFTHNWVGGDIHGLAAFAGTLYGYVPDMESVVTALNKKVGQIVTDASWQGSAAQAFTGNWETISAQVNAVGLVVIQTGSIVDQLAANLAKIENALESAAGKAGAHGVQVGRRLERAYGPGIDHRPPAAPPDGCAARAGVRADRSGADLAR